MISRAEDFLWRRGRLLDQRRFEYLFRNGTADAVVRVLSGYQNADGGFGYALEPDGRGPTSQPLHVWSALSIMDEVSRLDHATAAPICDYLTTITASDGGVPPGLPSIQPYPHSPWWPDADGMPGSILPTALIAGVLHKNHIEHRWLETASEFCWRAVEAIETTHPYEVEAALMFLNHAPDRDRAELHARRLGDIVLREKLVLLDPSRPQDVPVAPGYTENEHHLTFNYAPEPSSLARAWFSDAEVNAGLDALASRQQDDGGWPINWAVWTPATEWDGRSAMTIHALRILHAYERI